MLRLNLKMEAFEKEMALLKGDNERLKFDMDKLIKSPPLSTSTPIIPILRVSEINELKLKVERLKNENERLRFKNERQKYSMERSKLESTNNSGSSVGDPNRTLVK